MEEGREEKQAMLKQFPFAQRVSTHLISSLISSVLSSLWLGELNARNVCPRLHEMLLVYPTRTHLHPWLGQLDPTQST